MRKCKGDEKKQTLDTAIYLVVSVGTKSPLVHVVEELTQEYCFPVTKSLPTAPLDSPQRLAT
jgi:hypothetical protein